MLPDTGVAAEPTTTKTIDPVPVVEPEIVVHSYADAFEVAPEPPLTKTQARIASQTVEDPKDIMSFNYPHAEYLNKLYWRRIRDDSAKMGAPTGKAVSGSKATRRRSSMGPEAFKKRLVAAEELVASRQEVVDRLQAEIDVLDAETAERAARAKESSAACDRRLNTELDTAKVATADAYRELVLTVQTELFKDGFEPLDPRTVQSQVGKLKAALGQFTGVAREIAGAYDELVANVKSETETLDHARSTLEAAMKRQREALAKKHNHRSGALAKAVDKRDKAAELVARYAEDNDNKTEE